MKKRNEVSHYEEIKQYIETQMKSNLFAENINQIKMFWRIGELSSNLIEIVNTEENVSKNLIDFAYSIPPLNLDIFCLITDGVHFELLILEIKKRKSVGLKEWSQLVGYCIVSEAKYGLLINIDGEVSNRLNHLLQQNKSLSHISRIIDKRTTNSDLGLMNWNPVTHNFEYSNMGVIYSISKLTEEIINDFNLSSD